MFYSTTHSTHFNYGYMSTDIWWTVIQIAREETHCRLVARVLLYARSHRQYITYHGLCYTSRGALAGTRNSLVGSIRGPIPSWADALPWSYISFLNLLRVVLSVRLFHKGSNTLSQTHTSIIWILLKAVN